jgi:RNA polymerase sigma-70 factor (ECF subfamily)
MSDPGIKFQDLYRRLNEGDIESFKEIYHLFFQRVFHFACRFSLRNEDAEEITQDVFIKLWDKRSLIDTDKDLSNFLFTIAQNLAIDKIRKYVSEGKRVNNLISSRSKITSVDNTEQLVNFYELSGIVTKLIDGLPIKRRAIFKLSREKGFTNKEIADTLKISHGTVEKQMSKALKELKAKLKAQYGVFIDL